MRDRLDGLDGLRGLAALAVVLLHISKFSVSLTRIDRPRPGQSLIDGLLMWTPLHVAWAGSEAVWIFFILSGFVLSRPYLAGLVLEPKSYYPRRALRLYLPMLASIPLAMAIVALRNHSAGWSGTFHATALGQPGVHEILATASLLVGDRTHINLPWWSLHFEVWFSIGLPLVVLVARRLRGHLWVMGLACVAVSSGLSVVVSGHVPSEVEGAVLYLPMFGVGVALTAAEVRLRSTVAFSKGPVVPLLACGCAVALTATYELAYLTSASTGGGPRLLVIIGRALTLVGAAGFTALALVPGAFHRLLASRPVHWLGSRSYSLYLVHYPLVMFLGSGFRLGTAPVWFVLLAVAASLGLAEVFYRGVERPSMRLLRRIGRAARTPAARPSPSGIVAPASAENPVS